MHVQKLLLQILCTELLYRTPVASSLYNDFSVQSACTEYTASVQTACTERLYMSCTEASVQGDVCTDPPVQKACAVGSGFTTQLMKQSYFYMNKFVVVAPRCPSSPSNLGTPAVNVSVISVYLL